MNTIDITCQNCGAAIELTKTLAAPLLDSQRREYEDKIAHRARAQTERDNEIARREEKLSQLESEIAPCVRLVIRLSF